MKKGKRIIEKNTKVKRKMSYEEQEKKKKIIVRTFIIIVALIVLFVIAMIANNYIILDNNEVTNLVINNRNVTSDLKNNVLIENNVIYLSEDDVQNFFDKYLYLEEENNKFITTYDKKIAEIGFDEDEININGSDKQIYAHVINKDGINYLPVSEMKDVYNIEIHLNQHPLRKSLSKALLYIFHLRLQDLKQVNHIFFLLHSHLVQKQVRYVQYPYHLP